MEKFYCICIHDEGMAYKDAILERVVNLGPRVVYTDNVIFVQSALDAAEIYADIVTFVDAPISFLVMEVKPESQSLFGAAEEMFWKFFNKNKDGK